MKKTKKGNQLGNVTGNNDVKSACLNDLVAKYLDSCSIELIDGICVQLRGLAVKPREKYLGQLHFDDPFVQVLRKLYATYFILGNFEDYSIIRTDIEHYLDVAEGILQCYYEIPVHDHSKLEQNELKQEMIVYSMLYELGYNREQKSFRLSRRQLKKLSCFADYLLLKKVHSVTEVLTDDGIERRKIKTY